MTKNDKATYESYDRDEFDEPPVGPVGVHRGSRSAASRVLPYVVVLVVAALVGPLAESNALNATAPHAAIATQL